MAISNGETTSTPWVTTTEKLAGQTCLKHSVTGELCLFGTRGQIYQYSPTTLAALVYHDHTERLHLFPLKSLKTWKQRLEVPARGQAEFIR